MRLKMFVLISVLAAMALGFSSPPAAHAAGVTFFSSRAAFDFSAPGLPLENFESGIVADGTARGCLEPISLGNEQTCFDPNTLQPGVTYMSDDHAPPNPTNPRRLALAAKGKLGATSKVLVANYDIDSFVMTFSDGPNSIGFDTVGFLTSQTCSIKVFDASGQIGSGSSTCDPAGSGFLGVQSGTPITKIIINDPSNTPPPDGFEGVDNLEFGFVDFTTTTAHPAILDTSGPTVTLTLSATLKKGDTSLAGQTIDFAIGGSVVCSATTDSAGLAACGSVPEVVAVAMSPTMTYSATFKGGGGFGASTGSAGLIA